jgi:putative DNA primase/helicase
MNSTRARAQHRWGEILPQLGVDTRFLQNKHGPCPLCGGRDRYRFDDKDGSGSYYCNQCGPGNGIILVCKLHGWDFPTAAREVDKIIGNAAPVSRAPPRSAPANDNATSLAECRVRRALERACAPEIVARYLKRRGLSVTSPVLLGDPSAAYYDEGRLLGYFPAVLAPILSIAGELCSAAMIYDTSDVPRRKKFMPKIRTINGAAVRLFEPTDTLAVTEGIENALAVHEMYGLPAWAALNANGLATFEPPSGLRRLVIYGDNDTSDSRFTGQKAAYALASRLSKIICEVGVQLPPEPDVDWLDLLNARGDR